MIFIYKVLNRKSLTLNTSFETIAIADDSMLDEVDVACHQRNTEIAIYNQENYPPIDIYYQYEGKMSIEVFNKGQPFKLPIF